jgi:hypothetical protein
MRLFLDANGVFSACLSETGRAHAFFELARAGRCRLLSSDYALAETKRNLARKAPRALGRVAELSPWLEPIDPPLDTLCRHGPKPGACRARMRQSWRLRLQHGVAP